MKILIPFNVLRGDDEREHSLTIEADVRQVGHEAWSVGGHFVTCPCCEDEWNWTHLDRAEQRKATDALIEEWDGQVRQVEKELRQEFAGAQAALARVGLNEAYAEAVESAVELLDTLKDFNRKARAS